MPKVLKLLIKRFDPKKHTHAYIGYLSTKEGSLFCFVVMRSTEPGCFRCVLGVFGKLSTRREVNGLGSMTFGLEVQKFLNIE